MKDFRNAPRPDGKVLAPESSCYMIGPLPPHLAHLQHSTVPVAVTDRADTTSGTSRSPADSVRP